MQVWGCDVAKDYCILHNGKQGYYLDLQNLNEFNLQGLVVLEQTGAYGVRWAQIFESIGAVVYIADGKEFNRFRKGFSSRKDDYTDAYFLRKFYLNPHKRKHCRRFHPQTVNLRALIRQHIRNDKDITKHINRLRQYLAIIFPREEWLNLPKKRLLKNLETLKEELKKSPHALSSFALGELQKLEVAYNLQLELEKEISAIAQNHPDYGILKTFPYFGDILIATLIAFSWDINDFPDKDAYIGYVLMGAFSEQSGYTVRNTRTDKARTEVKGKFFNLFKLAHRKNPPSPYLPLAFYIKTAYTGAPLKRRYIKFITRILELTYYARRYRLSYEEVLKRRLAEIEKNIGWLSNKEPLPEYLYQLQNLHRLREVYNAMLYIASARSRNIPVSVEELNKLMGGGGASILFGRATKKPKGVKNDRRRVHNPIVGEVKGKIPQSGDIEKGNRTSDKRRDRATKGGSARKTSKGKVSEFRDLHLGKEGVQQWKGEGNDPPP